MEDISMYLLFPASRPHSLTFQYPKAQDWVNKCNVLSFIFIFQIKQWETKQNTKARKMLFPKSEKFYKEEITSRTVNNIWLDILSSKDQFVLEFQLKIIIKKRLDALLPPPGIHFDHIMKQHRGRQDKLLSLAVCKSHSCISVTASAELI